MEEEEREGRSLFAYSTDCLRPTLFVGKWMDAVRVTVCARVDDTAADGGAVATHKYAKC